MRNPYSVLGVPKVASSSEIKSAFRRHAKATHPDRNPHIRDPEIAFSDILAAYEILGDIEKRRQFDEGLIDALGRPIARRSMFRGFSAGMPGFGFKKNEAESAANNESKAKETASKEGSDGFADSTHEEIMEKIFGQTFVRDEDDTPGMDDIPGAEAEETVSFESSDIHVDLFVTLETALRTAPMNVTLPSGKSVSVKVPAGIENEPVVRLRGQGQETEDGQTGDAIIKFRFKRHPHLRIDGIDLHCDLAVPLHQGIAGAKLPVAALDGKILVSVPPWSGSDRALRVAGKGLPDHDGTRGDLLVHVRLMLPEKPVDELMAFAKSNAGAS